MNEQIHIFLDAKNNLRIVVKGDVDIITKMLIQSMEENIEVATLISTATLLFCKEHNISIVDLENNSKS